MAIEVLDALKMAAASPEGRTRVLRQLAAHQGELELMVELMGRMQRPARVSSDAVAALRALEADPAVQAMKAALWSGSGAGLDPAAVQAWTAGNQALLTELQACWSALSPQQKEVVENIGTVIVVLVTVRQANQDRDNLSPGFREELDRADRYLAEVWSLLRRALLEASSSLLMGDPGRR